jgi:polynucleotide 5'-kinase involved in rRNA processing
VAPLRRDDRVRLVEQKVSPLAVPRPQNQRIAARQARWRDYFSEARVVRLPLHELVLWGGRRVHRRQVVGLLDTEGFALALGLIQGFESDSATLEVLTPPVDPTVLRRVRELGLGNLRVDPGTGEEEKIG